MNNISPTTALCSFEDAKAFFTYKVPQMIYVGSPVYHSTSGELFTVAKRTPEGGELIPFHPIRLLEYIATNGFGLIPFTNAEVYKAYSSTELGLLLPTDYIAPINTVRGWAWMGNHGEIILKEKGFYKTEAEARAKLLLYFLELTIITLAEIEETWEKNFNLLSKKSVQNDRQNEKFPGL